MTTSDTLTMTPQSMRDMLTEGVVRIKLEIKDTTRQTNVHLYFSHKAGDQMTFYRLSMVDQFPTDRAELFPNWWHCNLRDRLDALGEEIELWHPTLRRNVRHAAMQIQNRNVHETLVSSQPMLDQLITFRAVIALALRERHQASLLRAHQIVEGLLIG